MSQSDIDRWNTRYGERTIDRARDFEPDQLLRKHASLFKPGHKALDVACGIGHNSLWLAEQGLDVFSLDCSQKGLDILTREADRRGITVTPLCHDLENWTWPKDNFDVITVFRYLNRSLFDAIKQSLKCGGIVVYQTFNQAWLEEHPRFNPDFVLAKGELARYFDGFETIDTNDGEIGNEDENEDHFAKLVARKP